MEIKRIKNVPTYAAEELCTIVPLSIGSIIKKTK
jgi:hypothetical protein